VYARVFCDFEEAMMKSILLFISVVGLTACAGCEPKVQPRSGGMETGGSNTAVTPAKVTPDKPIDGKQNQPQDVPPAVVKPAPLDPLRHQPNLAEPDRLVIYMDGQARIVDRTAALNVGYTEVDLSDTWTPTIFEERANESGETALNRYRKTFLGLSSNQTDGDGLPLRKGEKNFLEVFGIPPSMSVLRDRFVDDSMSECLKNVDHELIGSISEITYRNDRKKRKHRRRMRAYRKILKRVMKKAKVSSLSQLETQSESLEEKRRYVMAHEREKKVLAEIEKRLTCDGHMHKRYRHKKGKLDHGLRMAVRRFQRKHKIYEYTNLRRETMRYLSMPPLQANYRALTRSLRERVISASGILEDGSVKKRRGREATYKGADGQQHTVANLVEQFSAVLLKELDLDSAEKALAFFTNRPKSDFKTLRVGVRFPQKPEYYSDHMDLKLVIDRGSVWYDFPYNDKGKEKRQRRKKLPRATLYVRHLDQNIPLVNWPTMIGGWRTEMASNGYTYLKYKQSDVGDRIIRKIIAGPTWIAPKSTPLKSLAKRRRVNGKTQSVVNYKEMGPGYLSAYGLVAGYFVIPGRNGRADRDKGIRAHGSSEYMSILSSTRFSHGCHRMMNHHAVRMYGFLLNHRRHTVTGDRPMGYNRQFLYKDEVYQIHVPSRGFQYTMEPPLPVSVLEGKIQGEAKKPLEGYFKIPDKKYPALMPGEVAPPTAVPPTAVPPTAVPPTPDNVQSEGGGDQQ
jgi:hypothetical protein